VSYSNLPDRGQAEGEARIDADLTKVAGEQVETSADGQTVSFDLDIVDEICFCCSELGHSDIHPMGD
jgi:hypothetical protein